MFVSSCLRKDFISFHFILLCVCMVCVCMVYLCACVCAHGIYVVIFNLAVLLFALSLRCTNSARPNSYLF